jgi:hypothetical protein
MRVLAARRASRNREADAVPLIISFVITGTATGREITASRTRTASAPVVPETRFRRPVHASVMKPRRFPRLRTGCRQ